MITREPSMSRLPKPFLAESHDERRLHFAVDGSQSRMSLRDPNGLIDDYTRKMMAFLLFVPEPQHILMLGLGGGSLAKFCYLQLPLTRITSVEINPQVLALRDQFHVPCDNKRFRVICDDGANYLARSDCKADVILVDAFDAHGIALSLIESSFFHHVMRQLSENGLLVMNLCGERWRCTQILDRARHVFHERMCLVPVVNSSNDLLFAFKRGMPEFGDDAIALRATRLHSRLKLNFPRYLQRIISAATADVSFP